MRALKAAALGAVLAFGLTGAVWASSPMAGTFGNTVLVTDADGKVTKYAFKDGGTWTAKTPDGKDANGTWELTEGEKKICLTLVLPAGATPPEGGIKPACSEFVGGGKKAGDKWTQNDANGKPVTVEIKAGM